MCKCDKCGHEPLTPRMRAIRALLHATRDRRIVQAIVDATACYYGDGRPLIYMSDADLADALEKLNGD